MGKYLTWVLSFAMGAAILCFFATLQNNSMGISLSLKSYIVPFLFGGCVSLLAGMRHYRVKEVKDELQKSNDNLEIKVKERTAELEQDIIKRKQAVETLRYFQQAVESSSDAIGMATPGGRHYYQNEAFTNLFGLNVEEVISQKRTPLYLHMNEGIGREVFKTAMRGYEWTGEVEMRGQEGNKLDVYLRAYPIKDVEDKVIGLVGVHTDITERNRAEKQLRESHEKHRTFLENFQGIAYQTDYMNFNPLMFEGSVEKITGYHPDDFLSGKVAWNTIIHPEDVQPFIDEGGKFDKEEGFKSDIEYRILKKDGDVRWVKDVAKLIKIDEFRMIQGTLIDVTERKQVEEALKESEGKYRSIMESMKDAAYITSKEFRIEYMNPRMISRIGRDATGELCHKAIYNSDKKCSWCIFDKIQQGEHVEYELTDPKNNRYYSITNSPILHSGGSISKLAIFRDITEIKETEEHLHQTSKMESIGTIAGGIAHDFNNLLYMIVGNAELALEDIPEWNPTHTHIEEIKTASLRAAGIVKQLLNFSRKIDHKRIPISVITIVKDALKFMRSTIPSTVEIRKHLPDTDISIMADSIQINQILMNLFTNASQAMEETGGIIGINVEKKSLTEGSADNYPDLSAGEYVKITVSDTGPGIEPEIIDRIFDPYFTTKEVGKGSGMGLAVVHGLVNNHNGAITVDNELGKGATFTILLPMVFDEPVMEAKPSSDKIPRGNETILFVDDEESIATMIGQMLERLGYQVETQLNPLEALELFKSKPHEFDLVITDMTMPQMTGVKLSKKLKIVRSDIPVIICTGHSSLIDEDKAKEMGLDSYVLKPIVKREIARTIQEVLDKRQEK